MINDTLQIYNADDFPDWMTITLAENNLSNLPIYLYSSEDSAKDDGGVNTCVMYVTLYLGEISLIINCAQANNYPETMLMIMLTHELIHVQQFKTGLLEFKEGLFYWDGKPDYWEAFISESVGKSTEEIVALEIKYLPWEQEAYLDTVTRVGLEAYVGDKLMYPVMESLLLRA